jgi:hypothetical protein
MLILYAIFNIIFLKKFYFLCFCEIDVENSVFVRNKNTKKKVFSKRIESIEKKIFLHCCV